MDLVTILIMITTDIIIEIVMIIVVMIFTMIKNINFMIMIVIIVIVITNLQSLNERITQAPVFKHKMMFGDCCGAGKFNRHDVAATSKLGYSCCAAAVKR